MPEEMLYELERACRLTGIRKSILAKRCLKRFAKPNRRFRIGERQTIGYNSAECKARLYITMTEDMHHSVQALRLTQRVSVSYLLVKSIQRYLHRVVSILLRNRHRAQYLKSLDKTLGRCHFKISFTHSRIRGIRIVMLNSG